MRLHAYAVDLYRENKNKQTRAPKKYVNMLNKVNTCKKKTNDNKIYIWHPRLLFKKPWKLGKYFYNKLKDNFLSKLFKVKTQLENSSN